MCLVESYLTPDRTGRKLHLRTLLVKGIFLERRIQVRTQYCLNVTMLINKYFIATCGGGGISPTFGAALWVIDYSLQAALNGIERLYFHQGTIGNCVSSNCTHLHSFNLMTFHNPLVGILFLG